MRYALYDPVTGAITQWGYGEPPPGRPFVTHMIEGSLADYYVQPGDKSVRPKLAMTLSWPASVPAGSEAVISGLPAGTKCDCYIDRAPYHAEVDDGTLELTVPLPETVRIRFWHAHYCHDPIEVRFT